MTSTLSGKCYAANNGVSNMVSKPGIYVMRNGETIEIAYIENNIACAKWLEARWNATTGRHACSCFDIVGVR